MPATDDHADDELRALIDAAFPCWCDTYARTCPRHCPSLTQLDAALARADEWIARIDHALDLGYPAEDLASRARRQWVDLRDQLTAAREAIVA